MEDVLAVYALPYDPDYPVVCMDESSRQLIGEVHEPIPVAPGHPARVDHEYVRNGVVQLFIEVEPLAGRRHVAVTERRTAEDWAVWIRGTCWTSGGSSGASHASRTPHERIRRSYLNPARNSAFR